MKARPTPSGPRRKRRMPMVTLGAAAALALPALTIITLQSAQAAGTPAAASAIAAVQNSWSYVPEYSSAPTIDQGTVRDTAGRPVAGATVIVFPFLINGGKPGSVLKPIARAVSDGRGHFAIHLPVKRDALLMSRRSNGYLNLHVIAFYPGGTANWFAPIHAKAHVAHVNNLVLKPTVAVDRARVAPNAPATCVNSTRTSIGDVPVIVGFHGSAAPTMRGVSFSLSTAASTTMGAGVSTTSAFGGFSASGSTTQSSGFTTTWPAIAGASNNYYTAFALYYDQEVKCSNPLGIQTSWTVTMNSISARDGTPGAEPISAGNCVTLKPNSTQTYSTGTQNTFSAGANLEAEGFNINLSTQVGWSSNASITFTTGAVALPCAALPISPTALILRLANSRSTTAKRQERSVRECLRSGSPAGRFSGASSGVGRAAAGLTLAAVLIAACSGPGLRTSDTRAPALVSEAVPKGLVTCIAAPNSKSTGIDKWDTPIGFAFDSYRNRARRPLTVESVSLVDPHNLVLHSALLYAMGHPRQPLIQEFAWARLGQAVRPDAWADRQAIPGAAIPAERSGQATGSTARDDYQLVLDISSRTPRGGWAAGEAVRYSSGGQSYTVTTYTGYAIAPLRQAATRRCGPPTRSIQRAWRTMK